MIQMDSSDKMIVDQYHVFIKADSVGRITAVNSSAFVSPEWGIEIDRGEGDKYHHAQGNYFHGGLYTEDGVPRYKLVDGQAVERTEDEIAADVAAIVRPVTFQEQTRADLDFLAAMMGLTL